MADKSLTDVEQLTLLFYYMFVAILSKAEPLCEKHLYLFLLMHSRASPTVVSFDGDQ